MISVCDNSENCVLEPIIHTDLKRYTINNSDYKIDLWREFTKRWMVVGVFLVVILAVLGPKIGAPGGLLRTQYLSYIPVAYIAYASGRVSLRSETSYAPAAPVGVVLVSCAHAHVVTPALCVAAVAALRDLTDLAIIKGALYASVGAPCVWLSLSLSRDGCDVTAQLLAWNYVASLVAVPLSTYVLCDVATVPSWRSVAETCLAMLLPYCVGAFLPECKRHETRVSLCALTLLYVECCGRLRDAEGLMYIGDVLITMLLEATCLATSVATCWMYARCGLLAQQHALPVALASIPKCGFGVVSTGAACSWGVHSLPAAVATPLRATLLANMSASGHRDRTPSAQQVYQH